MLLGCRLCGARVNTTLPTAGAAGGNAAQDACQHTGSSLFGSSVLGIFGADVFSGRFGLGILAHVLMRLQGRQRGLLDVHDLGLDLVLGERIDDGYITALEREIASDAYRQFHNHAGAAVDTGRSRVGEVLEERGGQVGRRAPGKISPMIHRIRAAQYVLETLERGHAPADDLARECLKLLLAVQGVAEVPDVLLDRLQLPAELGLQAGVEGTVEDLLHDPARDNGTPDCRHLLLARLERIGAHEGGDPRRHRHPVFPDVEGQIVDGAIEAVEPRAILAIVERGSTLRHALVGNGILELLDLPVQLLDLLLAVKVEPLDVLVFGHCTSLRVSRAGSSVGTDERRGFGRGRGLVRIGETYLDP